MTILISNKLFLIFIITIILAVPTAALLHVFNHKHLIITMHNIVTNTNTSFQNTSGKLSKTHINAEKTDYTPLHGANTDTTSNVTTIESHTYKLAVKELKNILEEAKEIYLRALKKNETWRIMFYKPYSNFSKMFILNATIVNETTLLVGHTVYRYIIVHVYDAKSKLNFMPQRIQVNSILVELLPRNNSITYTGIVPYEYLVTYEGKTCKVLFSSIGFVEASYYLTVSADKINNNMYKVKITVARELGNTAYVNVVWLILIRN